LRDLARPERIFQALVDGLPSEFPPLRSIEVMPNNLPGNLSSFVGRANEMEHVRNMLASGRLLTLTGTGGTGKTRLALQAGAAVLADFPDGVWFVELATVSDSGRVVDSVAASLDIREDPDVPLNLTLRRALAQKRMLIILDNCEHLHSACADFATDVLRHCPEIKLLATSRHSLGISGEVAWAVPPLSTINPTRDLFQVADPAHTVSQYESVKLFIDRATSVKAGFRVTKQNAPAIAQICWRLDGIPLAIELAAARARVLTPEQIAARLDDRFRLLTGGGRSVLPHQQTLRTLIDWSFDLLSESERVLFRRLGVFGGSRTIEAIEAVCTGDGVDAYDALDLLQQLVDKSLLSVETGLDELQRYTMIESVWQYSREKLTESGELDAMRDRHLAYFLEIAEQAAPAMEGADVAMWLEQVDAERNNFRLAL
jgi:predicted ATPase